MPVAKKKGTKMPDAGKQKALEVAKEKGRLTYDDLKTILPEEATSEDIDEMMESCRKGPAACSVSDIVQSDTNEEMLAMRPEGRKFAVLETA